MEILKQFLELRLIEYDHLHGRIKLTKVINKINQDEKLTNFIINFSSRGELVPPRIFNAALHEKMFFIFGKSQRLLAGLCYCYLLHLRYLDEYGFGLSEVKEMEAIDGIQREIASIRI